jgi:ATP adenylyltransferase
MERLWSPWRWPYLSSAASPEGCIFCRAITANQEPLVVFSGSSTFVILNRFPYNSGHLMIAPHRHVARLSALMLDELTEMAVLIQRAEMALTEAYTPEGLNVGVNLGRAAGAGVADHVHVHVVPRWNGDTNFMTVVGEVRVLPETLDATGARLRPIFERLGRS